MFPFNYLPILDCIWVFFVGHSVDLSYTRQEQICCCFEIMGKHVKGGASIKRHAVIPKQRFHHMDVVDRMKSRRDYDYFIALL